MTDQEILENNAHIPTDEVLRDLADTEAEIVTMGREAEHLEQTPLSLPTARLDHMRAAARSDGIAKRREFVSKLKRLLELRGVYADHLGL